jgi:hypothetical protein
LTLRWLGFNEKLLAPLKNHDNNSWNLQQWIAVVLSASLHLRNNPTNPVRPIRFLN